jgi:hypothetical protein
MSKTMSPTVLALYAIKHGVPDPPPPVPYLALPSLISEPLPDCGQDPEMDPVTRVRL